MHKWLFLGFCGIFFAMFCNAFTAGMLHAQPITHLPGNAPNTRFLHDSAFISMRPGISFAGFSDEGGQALSLGQFLNRAAQNPESPERQTLVNIITKAQQPFPLVPETGQIEHTSNIIQYLAFETLAALILEENGITPTQATQMFGVDFRLHETVMPQLASALLSLAEHDKLIPKHSDEQPFDDYLDALRSYNNIARATDLYLGIENAYSFYNRPESALLTQEQKQLLMERFSADIHTLYNRGIKQEMTFAGGLASIIADEMEAGNRPLKAYLSLAYSALSVQAQAENQRQALDGYITEAIQRASEPAEDAQRSRYWMHQTGNGQPLWAEGPYYFDFVLKDAIAFWHAIRINNSPEPPSDPFRSGWFLQPVRWLAHISTPDGAVPPIDDGNKRPIQSADFLRWSSDYGDADIGSLFSLIHKKREQFPGPENLEDQFFLVEAAIPRIEISETEIPALTDASGQQLVIRHHDAGGAEHYILLNGEHGAAITSGEGHEQPDQLQLLYYRGKFSFLTDAGYDRGYVQTNSSWNAYRFTNTMQYDASDIRHTLDFVTLQNEGGLESPFISVSELRKASEHNEADLFYDEPAPLVSILSGRIQLNFEQPTTSESDYRRYVIFIKSDNPYIIDINDITRIEGRQDFVMRYLGNSDSGGTKNGWTFWGNSGPATTSPTHQLFLHTHPLTGSYTEEQETIHIQEIENRGLSGVKQPYPAIQHSFKSTGETGRYTTASILKISDSPPLSQPKFAETADGLNYFWHQTDAETTDLFIFAEEAAAAHRTVPPESGPLSGMDVSLHEHETIGFARFNLNGNEWIPDENFTANIAFFPSSNGPEEPGPGNEFTLSPPFPNPMRESGSLHYHLGENALVSIRVFDLLGRQVRLLVNETQTAGSHEQTWSSAELSAGVYVIRFTAATTSGYTFRKTNKISIIR